MKKLNSLVTELSRKLDNIAGLCIVGVMVLVVANILLRALCNRPIAGTYELVCYLTALGIGLALANCAVQKAHIAVDFVADRLALRAQIVIDNLMNIIALGFWSLTVWHLVKYARAMATSGLVSSTAQIPIYPIIYLIALGFCGLCLVLALRLTESISLALTYLNSSKLSWQSGCTDSSRKAIR